MATRTRKRKKPVQSSAEMKTVTRKKYSFEGDPGEEEEDVTVEVHEFATEPAYVRASAGVTKNLGNYESLRVDVSMTVPCYAEEAEEIYKGAADKVYDLLMDEVDVYLNGDDDAED